MFKLVRESAESQGIFGKLYNEKGEQVAVTLEHAYSEPNGTFIPKLPQGVYSCVKGQHKLASATAPFTTFEIQGVKGHAGILFHPGNYNNDSDGCVLLGQSIANLNGKKCITSSKYTFNRFMLLLSDVNEFKLEVV